MTSNKFDMVSGWSAAILVFSDGSKRRSKRRMKRIMPIYKMNQGGSLIEFGVMQIKQCLNQKHYSKCNMKRVKLFKQLKILLIKPFKALKRYSKFKSIPI